MGDIILLVVTIIIASLSHFHEYLIKPTSIIQIMIITLCSLINVLKKNTFSRLYRYLVLRYRWFFLLDSSEKFE